MAPFELWSDGGDIPVFAWTLKADASRQWDLDDLSDRLRAHGWLVPAYPMPADLETVKVQRIVVRNGLGRNLARDLLADIRKAVDYLDSLDAPPPAPVARAGFHH
jgi:glutamate decarboxylase